MIHLTAKVSEQVNWKCREHDFTTFVSNHTPNLSARSLDPQTLVPSGECIKTYCEQANRQTFHVYGHCQHAAWLFLVKTVRSAPSQQQMVHFDMFRHSGL